MWPFKPYVKARIGNTSFPSKFGGGTVGGAFVSEEAVENNGMLMLGWRTTGVQQDLLLWTTRCCFVNVRSRVNDTHSFKSRRHSVPQMGNV